MLSELYQYAGAVHPMKLSASLDFIHLFCPQVETNQNVMQNMAVY